MVSETEYTSHLLRSFCRPRTGQGEKEVLEENVNSYMSSWKDFCNSDTGVYQQSTIKSDIGTYREDSIKFDLSE